MLNDARVRGRPPKAHRHGNARRTINEWARSSGLSAVALRKRLSRGWPLKLALSRPKRRYVRFEDLPYGSNFDR